MRLPANKAQPGNRPVAATFLAKGEQPATIDVWDCFVVFGRLVRGLL